MPSIEDLKTRYSRIETEMDELGRSISVGLLRPAERIRVLEMTESTQAYVLVSMLRAASVRKIIDTDGKEMLFAAPRERVDMDVIQNVLDREGLEAVVKALDRLDPPKSNGTPKNMVEEAKN